LLGVLLCVSVVPAPDAEARRRVPSGFRLLSDATLAPGLRHEVLSTAGPQRVHVARLGPRSGLTLRPVLAGERLGGKPALERTSAMCARVRCLVAVNGDFFTEQGVPRGGVVLNGEPVRPVTTRKSRHLLVDERGRVAAGDLRLDVALVSADLQRITVDGVNRSLRGVGTVLYTPRYGASTRTGRSTFERTLRVRRPAGRLRIDQTTAVALQRASSRGNAAIPLDGAVISAHGRDARVLRRLWAGVRKHGAGREALIRVHASEGAKQSLGGRPVLVRNGRVVPSATRSEFASGRHPRTIVSRTRSGEVLLVTVDGRQPGFTRGMTLGEAARLMVRLGAVEAINLDGGGSPTFVVRGQVVNRPSDRLIRRGKRDLLAAVPAGGDRVVGYVERPVAVALAIVPTRCADALCRRGDPHPRRRAAELDPAAHAGPATPDCHRPGVQPRQRAAGTRRRGAGAQAQPRAADRGGRLRARCRRHPGALTPPVEPGQVAPTTALALGEGAVGDATRAQPDGPAHALVDLGRAWATTSTVPTATGAFSMIQSSSSSAQARAR